MEKEHAPEMTEAAENEISIIKQRCKMSCEQEEELLNALLEYYAVKETDKAKASAFWADVQKILDTLDMKG